MRDVRRPTRFDRWFWRILRLECYALTIALIGCVFVWFPRLLETPVALHVVLLILIAALCGLWPSS